MFLSWVWPRSVTLRCRALTCQGLLRETDRAGLGDAFEPSGDIDPVAHQVAVGLLDDIAEMDADAELYAALGRHAGVALDHAVLHLDCAAHSVDHAAKLNEAAVPGALDDAAMMRRDRGVDQVAPKPPEPRQRAIFIRSGEAAVPDHVGDQNRRDFPGLAHGAPSWSRHISPNASLGLPVSDGKDRLCAHSFRTGGRAGTAARGRNGSN